MFAGSLDDFMARKDTNYWLRLIPLISGSIGGIALFFNRIFTLELTESQARSDVMGVILSAVLILIGLLWQNIQSRSPESVDLIGEEGFELNPQLSETVKLELAWATHLLLTNTVTKTIIIYYENQVILRRGILVKDQPDFKIGAIVQRVFSQQKPVYLVDLKVYPGRIEFDYLPHNTQGVICQPLGKKGVMILGANIPRSYTKQDENWIQGMADKIALSLSTID